MCEVRFECLALVHCNSTKSTNCLCSSSHCLQDRDPDASCESQGIALQVHITIDKCYLMNTIWETVWKRADSSWLKIRAGSSQLVTVSPSVFTMFCACFSHLYVLLFVPPVTSILPPFLPPAFQQCSLAVNQAFFFWGWSFVLVWFQVVPGADDKFNSTRKQSAGAQFRVCFYCPEVPRGMKAVIILSLQVSLHCFQSAKHG